MPSPHNLSISLTISFSHAATTIIGDSVKIYYDGDDESGWYTCIVTKWTLGGYVVRFEDGTQLTCVQEDEILPLTESPSHPRWPNIEDAKMAVDATEAGDDDSLLRDLIFMVLSRQGHSEHPGVLNLPTKTNGKEVQDVYIRLLKVLHPAKCQLSGATEAHEFVKRAFVEIFKTS